VSDKLSQFQDLLEVLHKDAESLLHEQQSADSPTLRRSLVRSVFALIEGTAYRMKQVALETEGLSGEEFSPAERALLTEETYILNNVGRAQVRSANISILPNIRFAFYAFCKSYGADFKLPVSGKGWQALRGAIQIRHRLTHPKSATDTVVRDAELSTVMTAYRWFISNVTLALKAIVVSLKRVTGDKGDDEVLLKIIENRYEPYSR